MNLNDVGKKRGFNRIPQEVKDAVESERTAEIESAIQYTPKGTTNDYLALAKQMQEAAVKKASGEEEREKAKSVEEIRLKNKERIKERVEKNYPEVLDLIQAIKDRCHFDSGWDTMQVHALSYILIHGFNKLDQTLNLVLNQLENNNATVTDLLEVTKSMRNDIEYMGTKMVRSNVVKTKRPNTVVIDDPDNTPAPDQDDHTGETIAPDETAPLPEEPKKRKGMPKGGWPKKVKK